MSPIVFGTPIALGSRAALKAIDLVGAFLDRVVFYSNLVLA